MKSRVLWLGLLAFVLTLLIVLPARWVGGLLEPRVQCATWSGSIWRGQCEQLSLQQGAAPVQIDLLRWKLHPLALLRLALQADVEVRAAQGTATGLVELGAGGRQTLRQVSLSAVFDRRMTSMLASGWSGQLDAQNLELQLQGKQLLRLAGQLQLRNFNDGRGGALGSYSLVFPPASAPPFVGTLKDTSGPLEVLASLTVKEDRSWELDGYLKTRAGAPALLVRRLDMLGSADATGRRPLSAAGSFN